MTARHFVIPVFLVLCILLGGASLGGYLANLILQLVALPILVWAFLRQSKGGLPSRTLVWLAAAMVAVVLIQLVPLPSDLWTMLPGRERIAEGFETMGQPLPWLPISLSSELTLAGLLWLLPALAALVGVARLGAYRPSLLSWSLIGAGILSVLVSAMQLTGGEDSPFYFYKVTNIGSGVGFFANANHQAALLLCALPFVGAIHARGKRSRSVKSASGMAIVLAGIAMILAVGLAINGSMAGLGLGLGVAFASLLLLRYRSRPIPGWAAIWGAVALVAAVAFLFFGPLATGAFMKELETSTSTRQDIVANTVEAAADHLPLGSGVGTFAAVYRTYEDPAEINTIWVNHAHSDVVEIVLETGILGLLLLLAFLVWWGHRAWVIWIRDERPDHVARAAVIASAALIAHSFVDYPLRTAALSTLFAICVALMAQPRPSSQARAGGREEAEAVRHLTS